MKTVNKYMSFYHIEVLNKYEVSKHAEITLGDNSTLTKGVLSKLTGGITCPNESKCVEISGT